MIAVPPLVAVIGPVEPVLLDAFVAHYRALGVEEFHLAFHFPDHVAEVLRDVLLDRGCALPGPTPLLSIGPWHEPLHDELLDRLRRAAGAGWHLIADVDEFHTYPAPLREVIRSAEAGDALIVGGLLIDRVAADGSLAAWSPDTGLDAAYPLGGFLTADLLRGDPRKVVLARHDAPLTLGAHRAPGPWRGGGTPIPVHHFRWRRGVDAELRRRVANHTSGTWHEIAPAIRTQATVLPDHLKRNGGRIDVARGRVAFHPVNTDRTPQWWRAAAADLLERWRPLAHPRVSSPPCPSLGWGGDGAAFSSGSVKPKRRCR